MEIVLFSFFFLFCGDGTVCSWFHLLPVGFLPQLASFLPLKSIAVFCLWRQLRHFIGLFVCFKIALSSSLSLRFS